MGTAVEARSLASLIKRAGSPPPNLPANAEHYEPLVLYIARVPGSRDVFLTTMKPKDKVVSAQDVENSLFYCHLDSAEDEEVRSQLSSAGSLQIPYEEEINSPLTSPNNSALAQRRFAVEDTLEQLNEKRSQPEFISDSPAYPSAGSLIGNGAPHQQPHIHRKPVGRDVPSSRQSAGYVQNPPSPRKVLGPRPLPAIPMPEPSAYALSPSPGKENLQIRPPMEHFDRMESKPLSPGASMMSLTQDFGRLRSYQQELRRKTSITLIRRDPGSGNQWNVGRIVMQRDNHRSPGLKQGSAMEDDGVHLEICTQGYEKFISSAERQLNYLAAQEMQELEANTKFHRFLRLRQPKSPASPPPRRNNGLRSSIDFSRRSSTQSIPFTTATEATSTRSPSTNPAYTFTSPWNGLCEFSTGIGGRSLKCRHVLPQHVRALQSPNNAKVPSSTVSELRFNLPSANLLAKKSPDPKTRRPPLSAGHSHAGSRASLQIPSPTPPSSQPTRPSPISATQSYSTFHSRLSPNLPTSPNPPPLPSRPYSTHTRAHSDSAPYSTFSSSSSSDAYTYAHNPNPNFHSTNSTSNNHDSASDDEGEGEIDSRLDLSLGQERAGGGFSGKKAKLGKLIVQGAGLEMLDLVVAANMGFWWWVGGREG